MTNRQKWLLTIGLAILPLLGFWLYGLFDLDEGFYAAVVAEMNHRGEWITPYFNGHPWFEKPVLLYWFAKPSVLLFGQAVGPRMPSVLATIGLFILCGLYIRKRAGGLAGRWCVAMLGTSILIIALGRLMTTDALLDLAICGAFLSFYESLVGARGWRLMTAFCLGVSVLAKGPVPLPFFAALAIWTYAAEPALRPRFKGFWLLGTLILMVTMATWYLPAYLENGQAFVQKFFVEQNLQRFGGGDEAHKVPLLFWPIYYPVILTIGLLPWSIPLWKQWPMAFRSESALERYLARWALIILVFFTVSGVKLPHYILPAVPAFIMIGAIEISKDKRFSWRLAAGLSVGYCLLANVLFMTYAQREGYPELDLDARAINQMVGHGRAEVLTYKFSQAANSSNPLAMNRTSHPSLRFYLDQSHISFADTGNFSELVHDLAESWLRRAYVLSYPGAVTGSDITNLKRLDWAVREIPSISRRPQFQILELVATRFPIPTNAGASPFEKQQRAP